MSKWTKATGEPVTNEREVRVRNIETDEEGYVSITWDNREHIPRFFGPVRKLIRHLDDTGNEISPPISEVIDNEPTFWLEERLEERMSVHEEDDPLHQDAPKFAVLVWFNGDWQPLSYRYWTLADAEKAIELEKQEGNTAKLRASRIYT